MEAMNRREMLKRTGTGVLTGAALVTAGVGLEGCNASQWIQIAINDIPTVIQVITSVLSIASAAQGGVVDPSLMTRVNSIADTTKTELQTAQDLISKYQTAASGSKPGLLNQIDTALNVSLQNLNEILGAFMINDPKLQATIAAALGSAITIVVAITALVPASSAPSPAPVAQARRRATLKTSAKTDGNEIIKESYNIIVSKFYPQHMI